MYPTDLIYLQLLDDIFNSYDPKIAASRISAANFHDRMMNQFFPRYYALSRPELQAFQDKTPDDETPLVEVVVMSDPNAWPLKNTGQDVVVPSLTPTDGDV